MAVNPYRNFPIYDEEIIAHYKNQRRIDRPPHIYAVADTAYRSLIETKQNQSILITGESGAGKTENTKRVIQYLASIAGGSVDGVARLEEQIIRANPILEAFGNAQTVRNNNSSRFGKFVRIEFNQLGVISGGNIERYLLEKSRVTHRNPRERSFHVFYQFLLGAPEELRSALEISGGVDDYNYMRISNAAVQGLDDRAEFKNLVESMNVLGFSAGEQESFFRIIAAILHLGNLAFSEDKQGQAQLLNPEVAERVGTVLGIDTKEFLTGLLNPVFRAGRDEMVTQSRDVAQVLYSVEALSRSLYDRMFARLVDRINQSIDKVGGSRGKYIGVLDIAGFEIFEKNSFEQLCINHTNEKLQQFFNHHMFVLEQEEYRRENIEWNYIDFGLDLQPTIDLIEKANPIGLLACLDEDCVMPKATDKSYCEKVSALWKGKSSKFETTRFGDGFNIQHYAGRVEYNTDGWLVKNKDPLNENVTRLLARSSHNFIASLFPEFSGSDEEVYQANKGTKKGLFRTVAQKHRESLALLMQQLYATQPHFVRCIIPNEEKTAGVISDRLVLDQLRCNGVLEGIRICRLGYPHRLVFSEFCRLYEILSKSGTSDQRLPLAPAQAKEACQRLLEELGLREDVEYKMGGSKVFLKAGEIGKLDEIRDRKLSQVLRSLQALYRYVLAKRQKNQRARMQEATRLLQRNVRLYLRMRQWSWWRLFSQVKPLLNVTRSENRIEELEEELERLTMERETQLTTLRADLDKERDMLFEVETRRRDLERENQQLALQLAEANESNMALMERKVLQDTEIVKLKERIESELAEQREVMQQKLATQEQVQDDLRRQLDEQKTLITSLRLKLDESEFERIKLEKGEAAVRQRLAEAELLLEETRRAKRDLETKLRQVEEARRALQEKMEDEAADQAHRRQMEAEYELQLRSLKQQHEDDIAEREEEWEQMRRKLQREMHQLAFDLEQEKKQSASLKDTVKRYESGTDNLASQLEAEMRNQSNWKRERERLEQRLKEVARQHQEAVDREDALQAQLSSQYELIREFRAKASDWEEAAASAERQRRALETRYESLNEHHRELTAAKQALEKSHGTLESQLVEASNRLHDEQDSAAILAEKLRAAEQSFKVTLAEVEVERKQNELLTQEKAVLEMQIKDLQLKLLESETSSTGLSSRAPLRRPSSSSFQQILSQIDAESSEKQALLKENRRQERLIRDLQAQLSDRERLRISLEESLDKSELRLRKLQTALDAAENRNSELEVARRRAERESNEERDKCERLARECERFKARANMRASSECLPPFTLLQH